MKKLICDSKLLTGLILAHVLLYFSFNDKSIFWYIFSGSILGLIIFTMLKGEMDDQLSIPRSIGWGVITGLLLYFIFWAGYHLLQFIDFSFHKEISRLYKWFAPSLFWQYLSLVFVAAPGEELFWRGFVQKRLLHSLKPIPGILIGAFLYGSAHIYSGSLLLIFAAFLSGLVWGVLYFWKKSMPLVIVSHIIFDIMLFIVAPLP
ncbi:MULTISPECIES: CPBP family intramembrane glutamic endopeptidase [Neobacillus]|jgi:uncharacterized protein|uniref:CPBP family intramembrane metalloprotease n=1 Tax=Neobacillus sedimentimangrovi TaxID=2699460 RepID=A0ABS8QLV1_9BACI|nr:type II CAAX endopeptidase family protein [Neobacillus sedimentimangrovi]MCD4840138.1 CPBP family intramembrane metalloprotease [Neobacillus sedimentimangrovi]